DPPVSAEQSDDANRWFRCEKGAMSMIPFDNRDGFIWYDGRLVPWRDAKLHVLSHGLHYASCVFEGERVYNGKVFRLEDHNERLRNSARILGFEVPASMDDLARATHELISANNIVDGYVRPIDWRGQLAEGTGANIFLVINGELHTPTPDCFLDGITRKTVIGLARKRGIKVVERAIMPNELAKAQEVFLTGSAAEVTPVGEIAGEGGHHRFTPGAICRLMWEDFDRTVGKQVATAA